MATITSSGTGSGLDIAGIVDQLVAAERAPVASRLTAKESKANELLSALGKFKSSLATFQSSLTALKDLDTFQGRKITVGDDKVFTATATGTSLPGNYSVEVTALAAAHRLSTAARPDATSAVGTGIISITVNGTTSNIAIDDSANSLNDIRNAINAAPDNPGVRATIVTGADGAHLVLSATKTGVANAISVAVSGGDGGLSPFVYAAGGPSNTMTELTAAADAGAIIDGVVVSSATNTISDAIEGVTLNLVSANPGTELALGIGYDTDGAKRSVGNFVNSYNKLVDTITELTKYNKDTNDAAPLLGDSTVRGIRDQMRREISSVAGNTDAGIAGQHRRDHTDRWQAGRRCHQARCGNRGGFRLHRRTVSQARRGWPRAWTPSSAPPFPAAARLRPARAISRPRSRASPQQRASLDERLVLVRARLSKQFNAMDSLLAQLKTTSSFLSAQLPS